ncbi:MAG: hypothetical protein IT258_13315 [Saprospiraceae bacterium]|nr:hypothetical protein [Saprospiraceae bacterium]
MKQVFFTLLMSILFFACKKDKGGPYVKQPSDKVVVVAAEYLNAGTQDSLRHFVMLSDLEGQVLDFEEIVSGSTTVLSTGDPDLKFFDLHIFVKIPNITPFTRINSYHYTTGDTLYLGEDFVPNTAPLYASLKVNGILNYPFETVAETNVGPLLYKSFDAGIAEFEAKSDASSAISMYLTYGSFGDDYYRFYWNSSVGEGSVIELNNDELEVIPPLAKIAFPQGVYVSKVYVTGKPKMGKARHLLAQLESHSGTNEVPIFIPDNFATDFTTEIVSYSGIENYNTVINSAELPTDYQAPLVSRSVELDPGKSLAFTGTGFDTYKCIINSTVNQNSWYVSGSTATTKRFIFPKLSDTQKSLLDFDPDQYSILLNNQSVIHYEPTAPSYLTFPESKREIDFVRRDIVQFQ